MGKASKYYTPGIEEFHVGFEYEFYEGFDDNGDVYEKRVFHEHEEPYYYKDSDSVRVKHLDREDIESLGYKYLKKGWGDESSIYRNDRGMGSQIYTLRASLCQIKLNEHVIFEGDIKNKSELKRILKQLGI